MRREELLEIIQQAERERWTQLRLRNKGITELPDEIGQLYHLEWLDLTDNQLTSLPECIGQLTFLRFLSVFGNQLTSLPENIVRLTNLDVLDAALNQLTSLPETLGQLANLRKLNVSNNNLTSLPEVLVWLTNLEWLWLNENQLTSLPEWIGLLIDLEDLRVEGNKLTFLPGALGQLTKLRVLQVGENQLTSLPEWIAGLTNLEILSLDNNKFTHLPASLAWLTKLSHLSLNGNPMNPALESAYQGGLDSLRAYLISLESPGQLEALYETKLILVGEGAVGKTSLLKALTGREPREGEPTTHGVSIDFQALHLTHPEIEDVPIKLNAWDFGGQEVYRVTHQFFYSRRSLYLLVWEPRRGVEQCQVEDWLKLLRLRVGQDARIIIVSTHCQIGGRIARIDQEVLRRDYGPLIAGFHEVDSLVDDPNTGEKVGIARLKELIAEAAKELEQMGMPFNREWRQARDAVLEKGESQPRIPYHEFAQICAQFGLSDSAARTLAHLMHDLGYIVYYGDDERLQDEVVLQPEWLTKAISFVLEDRINQEMDGILPDDRLREVWWEHPFDHEPRYEPEFYPFFLRLMEKYDVSYRLEEGNASLIAQHVPQVRPELPWLPGEDPKDQQRRLALVCVMEEAPPGLVPWMIVRTHNYAYIRLEADGRRHRLHWQKGMFLRNKSHGEALLELRERELHVYGEAVWPEFFVKILQKTLHKLITDNWPGLQDRYYFAVPCRGRRNGKACDGRFEIAALRQFLEEGDETYRCQVCRTRQNIVELLYGFEVEDSREQLQRIETKLEQGFVEVQREIAGLESRLANYVMTILQAIASESKEGPRLFTIEPADGNWKRPFTEYYHLHLWCEAADCQHPVLEEGKGIYEIAVTREWVQRIAPYANFVAGVLKTLVPMVGPAVNIYFGDKTIDESGLKNHLDLLKEGTGKLLGEIEITDHSRLREGVLSDAERSGVLALHGLLREIDPNHERLGLKRVPTYTGDYLWLCQKHYEEMQPKIPEKIEFAY